ncbi:MAG: hypothetical protein K8R69_11250 [Deltaproteobacteria bacterium]|nr:hypothetical protein [Deltaproteobacteria bacterium]
MQPKQIRSFIDARYWTRILGACTMGETFGDYLSRGLHLGYGLGSLGLICLFAFVMALERRSKTPNEARYWVAIVVTSTTGTTMADFVTRTLKLGYGGGTALLLILLGAIFLLWPRRRAEGNSEIMGLPSTDARYWTGILVVSTLGTTLGDFASDGLGLGSARAALALGALFVAVLMVEYRAKVSSEARYWTAIVLASTIGATTGDFLTKDDGLNLGYGLGSAILVGVFAVVYVAGGRRPK